jgi:TonB family protein
MLADGLDQEKIRPPENADSPAEVDAADCRQPDTAGVRRILHDRPLITCFILSAIIHVLLIVGVATYRPASSSRHHQALTVEIQSAASPESQTPVPPASTVQEPAGQTVAPAMRAAQNDATARSSSAQDGTFVDPQRYYEAWELDEIPSPLQTITPEFPIRAKEIGVTGTVKLELLIDEDGNVLAVNVIEAMPKTLFDQAAIEAFSRQTFQPGKIKSTPVKSRMVTVVVFDETPLDSIHPR